MKNKKPRQLRVRGIKSEKGEKKSSFFFEMKWIEFYRCIKFTSAAIRIFSDSFLVILLLSLCRCGRRLGESKKIKNYENDKRPIAMCWCPESNGFSVGLIFGG